MDLVRVLAAIFLPPLGVFLQVGLGKDFWINLVLTMLFFFPGMIHAIYIIGRK
ncbi:YqaE/Pmp3 family membrane protein [Desertifilum sp. FACHB-1129]|uniref:Proteolipid membrane potential modulator n=2 Tax=Desertifilum tharense IPPAS B-1220 TaxID=1781255 RepID=A0A1E5QGB0_9CYAN|nr:MULTISPECIES: YqaE/Pmp3 family membrane protein [Cyanophyceae]MCD8489532.1 YqaE/Pmp3 family membrane protein [Desertifilum sp.]MDA0210626.1 YqaE/Pmp3 family membrane protein [Cyanobacteria bacterium FC1]NES96512.1 YqaE/Pmp3 family membrane protein [Desertifilum sp. SIO1I2]MBD2314799.1 YqaE/Pmp3 family membrane protein [Desertifilum sp. FACHB-1129]MBD2323202.1 YqaE/Pmp3 family membrane protein [Desertifilum sp. FACHB-866]